jgi:cell division protein FtsN
MLFGLGLGLVVAAGVYFRALPSSAPSAAVPAAPEPADENAGEPAARDRRSTTPQQAADAEPEPNEPRFDFYEILPQFEVVVPEEKPTRPVARTQPVEEPGSYVLQAGSFNALADADRLKARIALLGIESRIQRVEIDDNVFHRVRIGPISNLDQLNRVRRQLRDAQLETMLIKMPR